MSAIEAGASYLGVVFAGGPRRVTVQVAAEISGAGSGIPVFGVYGDQVIDEILRTSEAAGLRGAQLHGQYSRADADRLQGSGLLVWRVVRLAGAGDLAALDDAMLGADAVLVEARAPHAPGGTGVPLDSGLALQSRRRLAGHTMVLAGGLTPATVARAAALVRPEVVDVSSGVESLPGIKDPEKIARFMEAVCGHSAIS